MRTIKCNLVTIASACALSLTAHAEGLSSSLPFGKSLAAGQELPLPIGVSGNVFYLEQDLVSKSVLVDLPKIPEFGLPFPLPGLIAKTDKLESINTSTTAKIDAWILPFLNIYGVAGYVDGETTASGLSINSNQLGPNLSQQLDPLFKQLPDSFGINYSGPVYGGGATLAAGFGNYFVSLDANYTESDLDIGDSTIEAFTVTPRIGINGSLGNLSGTLYIGAQYQDVDENQTGTANFTVPGKSIPVEYDVVSEAEEEWNYLIGFNIETSNNWNYGIEAGFSDRKHVMATLNYRF